MPYHNSSSLGEDDTLGLGLGLQFGNGTIDPSLLGGRPPSPKPPSRSPSPLPSFQIASPPRLYSPPCSSVSSSPTSASHPPPITPPPLLPPPRNKKARKTSSGEDLEPPVGSKGKGKGKGKEKVVDTPFVPRPSSIVTDDTNSTTLARSKRARKPKVPFEIIHSARQPKVPSEITHSTKEPIYHPPEFGYCHQCRRNSALPKMTCTSERGEYDTCGLKYCSRCIDLRYRDIEFDEYATYFICPRCDNTCNCDLCCRRRGERFIGMRDSHKLFTAKTKSKQVLPSPSPSNPNSPLVTRTPTPDTPEPSEMLSNSHPNQFWGAVYSVDGRRLGAGFMDVDTSVVVRRPTPKPGPRTFVGTPQNSWLKGNLQKQQWTKLLPPIHIPGQRAFVGSKAPLSNPAYKDVKKLCQSRSPPPSPDRSHGWHQGGEIYKLSSPLTPLTDEDDDYNQGFAIAQALSAAQQTE